MCKKTKLSSVIVLKMFILISFMKLVYLQESICILLLLHFDIFEAVYLIWDQ